MTWWMWGFAANLAIAGVEYMNRSGGYKSFLDAIPHTFVPILIAQIALFYCWRDAPRMLLAWALFTGGNCVLRVLSTWWMVGEPINWTVMAGVAMVLAGGRVISMGYGQ